MPSAMLFAVALSSALKIKAIIVAAWWEAGSVMSCYTHTLLSLEVMLLSDRPALKCFIITSDHQLPSYKCGISTLFIGKR